jgi:3-mercaptopyruvate sulfurtransferase SseA
VNLEQFLDFAYLPRRKLEPFEALASADWVEENLNTRASSWSPADEHISAYDVGQITGAVRLDRTTDCRTR